LGVCISDNFVYFADAYDKKHQAGKIPGIDTVEQVVEKLRLQKDFHLYNPRKKGELSISDFNHCKENQAEDMICVLYGQQAPKDCATERARYPRPKLSHYGDGCAYTNPSGVVVSKLPSTTKSWSEIDGDTYQCYQSYPYGASDTVCIGEETKLVKRLILPEEQELFEPGTISTLGTAATYGAAYAVAPELLGDAFRLLGLASEASAEKIKWATSLILVGLSGSWLSAGAAWGSERLLKKIGCSDTSSRLSGQAVAVSLNLAQSFTPMGAATLCVSALAGKFGLWAEKRVVEAIAPHSAPSLHAS
jgi:hypothetical protein